MVHLLVLGLAVPAFGLAPDIALTRSYVERGVFVSLACDDSAGVIRNVWLGGTGMQSAYQFYIVGADSSGQAQWTRLYGTADRCEGMTRGADGSLVMVGYTVEGSALNYRLMRVSPTGTLSGSYDFGGNTTDDVAHAAVEWPANRYYLAGQVSPGSAGGSDASLVRAAAIGQVSWSRQFAEGESAQAAAFDGDSTLFLFCTSDSTDTLRGRDLLVIRTDTSGVQRSSRRFAGPHEEMCSDGVRLSSALTVIVGSVRPYGGGARTWNVLMLATNDAGDSLWSRSFGGSRNDVALAVCETFDRDSALIVAGWSEDEASARRRGMLMKVSRAGDSLWTVLLPATQTTELADVVQDSLYRYHAAGRLHTSYDYGLYVRTEPDPRSPGPHPPQAFSLLAPTSGDTVRIESAILDWFDALDPDSADTVTYSLWLDFDTLFTECTAVGPLDSSRYVWQPDTDDVRVYWRVTARDREGHERVCRERQFVFVCSIPESTAAFSLQFPDSGTALPRPVSPFRWQRARDPDPTDTVRYTLHFESVDTTLLFSGLRDTFITISFEGMPVIGEAEQVTWYVTTSSNQPPMVRESRERWTFTTWSAEADAEEAVAREFALRPPYPNPFNASTRLRFSLERTQRVELDLYSIEGRRLSSLLSGVYAAGEHTVVWDGTAGGAAVPSGLYFAVLSGEERRQVAKLMLLR